MKGRSVEEIWQEQLRNLSVETVRNCVLCGEVAGQHDERWYRYLGLVKPYDILRCPRCGLRWLSPRPDAEGYRKLYSSDMYFGGEGAPPEDYQSVAKERIRYWRSRVRNIVSRLDPNCLPATFLDYGAATGEFVKVATEEGHACIGMELSADARATAQVRNGVSLLSTDQMDEISGMRFDVIHMNHVLEHVSNPLTHLCWCANQLSSRGLLVLEVPQQFDNDLDRLRRWLHMGGKRPRFDPYSLHHTYFFGPTTMAKLLRLAGFEVLNLSTFNKDKTPLWPVTWRNWALRVILESADRLHSSGNIIEVYAKRA